MGERRNTSSIMVNKKDYLDHYRNHYLAYGKSASGVGLGSKPELLEEAGYEHGMSLLDYGCGWGALAGWLPKETSYLGVDITPEAIDLAREENPNRNFKVIENGQLKTFPKDFAVAFSVFTHALKEDVPLCLKDIHHSLKKTGTALVDILEGAESRSDMHLRYWSKQDFENELTKAGFVVKDSFVRHWSNGFTHTYFILNRK